jgi:hypothetical protein
MDTEYYDYNPFPSATVGGAPGDYFLRVPVSSKEATEFCIVCIANLSAFPSIVTVSGVDRPKPIDQTQPTIYTDTAYIRGQVISIPAGNTIPMSESFYDSVDLPRGEVYVRIDGASTFTLVTIKFRVKILKKIPVPFRTVAPENERLVHAERERRIQAAVLAQEGEQYVYGNKPPTEPIIEPEPAGTGPVTKLGYWGKLRR